MIAGDSVRMQMLHRRGGLEGWAWHWGRTGSLLADNPWGTSTAMAKCCSKVSQKFGSLFCCLLEQGQANKGRWKRRPEEGADREREQVVRDREREETGTERERAARSVAAVAAMAFGSL